MCAVRLARERRVDNYRPSVSRYNGIVEIMFPAHKFISGFCSRMLSNSILNALSTASFVGGVIVYTLIVTHRHLNFTREKIQAT